MLRDTCAQNAAAETAGVVLTCANPDCQHTYEPHPETAAAGSPACPRCDSETLTAGVDEPTVEPTPAQQQAELLSALAAHLRAHPNLNQISVDPGKVHIWTEDEGTPARDLADWFASAGATDLHVRLELGKRSYAAVHMYGAEISGHPVPDLWGTIPGLQRLLVQAGWGRMWGGLPLTLAELEHFAEHGTLPEAGEPR